MVLLTGKEPPDLIDPQNFSWNWREHISLSPHLAAILDRMLQLRPHDRFASAQDVLTALQSERSSGAETSDPSSSPVPIPPPLSIDPQPPLTPVPSPPPPVRSTALSLLEIFGKTWLFIAAIVGAIGLGWLVASLLAKRPAPLRSTSSIVPSVQAPATIVRQIGLLRVWYS